MVKYNNKNNNKNTDDYDGDENSLHNGQKGHLRSNGIVPLGPYSFPYYGNILVHKIMFFLLIFNKTPKKATKG